MDINRSTKRSVYLDVIKGFAILLVVFSHCIQWGSGSDFHTEQKFFSDPLFKFIYGFHMPLFMVVSGYLYHGTIIRHGLKKVLLSRVRSLLLPILCWQTLYLVLLFSYMDLCPSLHLLFTYFRTLWFLWSVLIACLLVGIGFYFFNDSLLYYLFTAILLLFIPNWYLDSLHVFMFPNFVIGYLWSKSRCEKRYYGLSRNSKMCLLVVSVSLYMVLYSVYDTPERSVYINGTYLLGRDSILMQFLIDITRYVYGFLGVVMVMVFFDLARQRINDLKLQKFIVELGRNTMGIYIINYFTTQVLLVIPNDYRYFLTLFECVLMLSIAYGMIQLIRKSRLLRCLFLGEI